MPDATELLLHNGLAAGAVLLLVALAALALLRLAARLSAALAGRAAGPEQARARWLGGLRRAVALALLALGLGLLVATLLLARWQLDLGALAWTRLAAVGPDDLRAALWTALQLAGVFAVAFAAHLVLRGATAVASAATQEAAWLAPRRDQLQELFTRLALALRWGVVFGALLVAAHLVALPTSAVQGLTAVALVWVAVYVARAAVSAAHLVVDVLFDVSDASARVETPLKYIGRLRHLSGVTKRTLDYFIYVGAATIVCDGLQPDTWASQTGRVAIRVIAIVYLGRVLVEVCELMIRELLLKRPAERTDAEQQQRETLVPVATSLLRYAIYFCSTVMALQEIGVDTSPLLASAGILGLAAGLGAQAFVGDVVAGFFILFESLFLVGDRVQICDVTGVVEDIGVRVTKIRDEAGVVHAIPNGEVRRVASHSRQYVHAVVEFSVPYGEDLSRVFTLVTACVLAARRKHDAILAAPELRVQELRESAVSIRCMTRVKPGCDDDVAEALRAEIVRALSEGGVPPPFARLVLVDAGRAGPASEGLS